MHISPLGGFPTFTFVRIITSVKSWSCEPIAAIGGGAWQPMYRNQDGWGYLQCWWLEEEKGLKVWVSRKWKKSTLKRTKKITALKKVLKKGDALFKVLKKVLIKLTKKK